jgi:hypothetical protein
MIAKARLSNSTARGVRLCLKPATESKIVLWLSDEEIAAGEHSDSGLDNQ